jgi:hypothetical protein
VKRGLIVAAVALILSGCGSTSAPADYADYKAWYPPSAPGVPFDPNLIVDGPAPGEYTPPTSCPNLFAGPWS